MNKLKAEAGVENQYYANADGNSLAHLKKLVHSASMHIVISSYAGFH